MAKTESKDSIRKKLIARRKALNAEEIEGKSEKVFKNLLKIDTFLQSNCVLLYTPISNEVATELFFNYFQKRGSNIFLPAYFGSLKIWGISEFEGFGNLETGPFNVLQPKNPKSVQVSALDLAILPGVAFSSEMHRLGYGKGVYDRLLGGASALKIGLAYDFQIVKDIPLETHDLKMDFVVMESGVLSV